MSGYGDVKRKKVIKLLAWLKNSKGIETFEGGRHKKVRAIETQECFPIPCSHPTIDKNILKEFCKWLVKNKICTKQEFDKRIK